jgi:lipopolysaccharide/colanic/teichoic acid biosynthesis glycosyltransferase
MSTTVELLVEGKLPPLPSSSSDLLLSTDQFRLVVAKERMRADRHGLTFSLLIFDLPQGHDPSKLRKFKAVLDRRLRLTDERGYFDGERIGVLLPHTHRAGAHTLLASLLSSFDQEQLECSAKVYQYPHTDADELDSPLLQHHDDEDRDGDSSYLRVDSKSSSAPSKLKPKKHVENLLRISDGGDSIDLIAPAYPRWKRMTDILLAAVGLVCTSPILLASAIAIKSTTSGPVFFKQWRTGERGKPFQIMKLRTMVVDAEELKSVLQELNERDGPAFKMKTDPRVTKVGRFLRATGIDELPQLWNVLKGQMAVVGPRPLPCDEDAKCEAWQRRRLDTRPGITCFWQIMKSRVEAFDDWMRLDLRYLRERSLSRDVRLMAKTITAVILGRVGH